VRVVRRHAAVRAPSIVAVVIVAGILSAWVRNRVARAIA